MELVAKIFNSVIKTGFEEFFDLLLEIFVLLSCAKPRFSHDVDKEAASWEEKAMRKEITPEAERETCQTTE